MQGWEIEYTDQFGQWWNTLDIEEQEAVEACIPALRRMGPGLGRPLVDTIKGSRHANLKELRPRGTNIRILFAFDPRRVVVTRLIAGSSGTPRTSHELMRSMRPTWTSCARKENCHEWTPELSRDQ